MEPVDLLWAWLREGWRYRRSQGWDPSRNGVQRYKDQIDHEMKLIIEKGFESYFLLVSDIVRWAKDNQIVVGPGRGSSAASIVCFLLRITEPDPLDFPLTDFSRFVDPTREDLPDIDIDFDDARRHEVREYAERRYGREYVGNIGTFTKYKGKNTLKDIGRVFSVPKGKIEELKNLVLERSGGDSRADASLGDMFEMFPAAQLIRDEYPEAIEIATRVEGNLRGMGLHAAGLVIASQPINDFAALYTRETKSGGTLSAVSVDKYDAEKLNLMKVDLLGLSTMGMIALAIKYAGLDLEYLYRLPLNDPETLAAFEANDVIGVFQFEGRATRLVGREMKPNTFLELVDINALSRPGPLFSGTTIEYSQVKHGKREPTRIHPVLDAITKDTKGQIIYQEQILHALADFGGLSVKRVHEIRRIISKKLGEAAFNTSARDFAANAGRLHGVSEKLAMEVWGRVVTSASYAFVYSHSLAYTVIGYWCMWLKVHHPAAFYTAQLQKIDEKKWPRLIRDAEAHGITIKGVELGKSGETWTMIDRKTVAAGYLQLKGVGAVMAGKILAAQEEGKLRVADDLLAVNGVGPKTLDKFRAQIESDDPFGLLKVQISLDAVRGAIDSGEIPIPKPSVNSEGLLDVQGGARVNWMGFVKLKEYKDIIEDERSKTGDDLETIRARLKDPDLATSVVLHCYDDGGEEVYVFVKRWRYPEFAEAVERIRLDEDVVYFFGTRTGAVFGASMHVTEMIIIDPSDDDEENDDE